jgi:hypothetical protein
MSKTRRKKRPVVEKWYAIKLYARSQNPYFALANCGRARLLLYPSRKSALEDAVKLIRPPESATGPKSLRDFSIVCVTVKG